MSTPAPRSAFVTVVAWFGIALGGMSVLVGVLQMVMVSVMFSEGPWAELDQQSLHDMPRWFGWIFGHFQLLVAANLLAMGVLLAASIGLLRRRNWARIVIVALLVLGIVANLGGLGLQLAMMQSMPGFDAAGAPADFAASFARMRAIILVVSAVVACAFAVLYGWIIRRLSSPAVRSEFGA
jgi:hypothetical protein